MVIDYFEYFSMAKGLLPDTQNCGMRMRRECRERFAHHRCQRKPLVSDPGMHHGTCFTHVPWCMSGSLTRGGGENVAGIPGACATHNFAYLVRGPWTFQAPVPYINRTWTSVCLQMPYYRQWSQFRLHWQTCLLQRFISSTWCYANGLDLMTSFRMTDEIFKRSRHFKCYKWHTRSLVMPPHELIYETEFQALPPARLLLDTGFLWIVSRKYSCIYLDIHRLWYYFVGIVYYISLTALTNMYIYCECVYYVAYHLHILFICIWSILHDKKETELEFNVRESYPFQPIKRSIKQVLRAHSLAFIMIHRLSLSTTC